MSNIQINIIFQSESFFLAVVLVAHHNPLSRVLAKLSTLPPMVTPSEVGLIVLERKATWISAEIDVFLCSRSNVYAISSASFNATRPFCFMLVTVLRASTLAPTYVSSNSYVTCPPAM